MRKRKRKKRERVCERDRRRNKLFRGVVHRIPLRTENLAQVLSRGYGRLMRNIVKVATEPNVIWESNERDDLEIIGLKLSTPLHDNYTESAPTEVAQTWDKSVHTETKR